jgi:response regulator RpfG family c-di-GMP phosphodiesterase
MNKSGPIIVIEDDSDDQDILNVIFKKINYPNEVIFFSDAEKALEYLNKPVTQPFLILSDVNMPKMNGFELREKVHTNNELSIKCIPYLFFTTSADKKAVVDAYSMSVQGFFIKPGSIEELERTVKLMMDYWTECISPNQFR